MPPQSKRESPKPLLGPSRASKKKALQNNPTLILTLVNEAVADAPYTELKEAAKAALLVLQTIQTVKENKDAYVRLGDDSGGLIIAIWTSYKEAGSPGEWLSVEMQEILGDITHTLKSIHTFVQDHISRNKAIRVMFNKADAIKIGEYREHLNYALQKFELQSQRTINEDLLKRIQHWDENEVRRAVDISAQEARDRELAEEIHEEEVRKQISVLDHQKRVEIDCLYRDERWHLDELKKIELETNERQSELERLRATASAMERAKFLKNTEEMAELKRNNAAEENSQPRSKVQAQSSKEKSPKRKCVVEEEEGLSFTIEGATSEEEEEVERPVRRSSKEKKKPSKSPKRRPVTLEDFTDDDEQSLKSPKTRRARRKPSRTSVRVEETSGDSSESMEDEEDIWVRSHRKTRSLPGSPLGEINDWTAQIKGLSMPFGNGYNSHLGPPTFPTSESPFCPSPGGPYGYGVDVPGRIINSGVGNITNSTISNVGNDNSRRLYRSRTP